MTIVRTAWIMRAPIHRRPGDGGHAAYTICRAALPPRVVDRLAIVQIEVRLELIEEGDQPFDGGFAPGADARREGRRDGGAHSCARPRFERRLRGLAREQLQERAFRAAISPIRVALSGARNRSASRPVLPASVARLLASPARISRPGRVRPLLATTWPISPSADGADRSAAVCPLNFRGAALRLVHSGCPERFEKVIDVIDSPRRADGGIQVRFLLRRFRPTPSRSSRLRIGSGRPGCGRARRHLIRHCRPGDDRPRQA